MRSAWGGDSYATGYAVENNKKTMIFLTVGPGFGSTVVFAVTTVVDYNIKW